MRIDPGSDPPGLADPGAEAWGRRADRARVLTVNGGSSSLRFALFAPGEPPSRLLSGKVERIGKPDARLSLRRNGQAADLEDLPVAAPDHAAGARAMIEWLGRTVGLEAIQAVGHRVVHGGTRLERPERITPDLIEELRRLSPIDPDHLPGEIALIEAIGRLDPDRPQVACFDTAFHHDLPRVARVLPIPRRFEATGVRRFGFHGLSYSYLMRELNRVAGPEEARGRVILAHLGAGASLAAVRGGACIETTMGFTPTGGLVMGTRSGDLDPGLLTYLIRTEGLTADRLDRLVNRESGLLGISETSPDVRDLLTRQGDDPRAAEALDVFCYQARKWVGALAAALGGLETLVFSGGIGENSAAIRARICAGLEFLGIALDDGRNAAHAALISADGAPVNVRVIPTDEESTIARAVFELLDDPAPIAPAR